MPESETRKAPPTTPGAIRGPRSLPLSRPAIWALVCGVAGLVLSPLALAGIIVGIVALRRLSKQKGTRSGHALAIGGIVTGGLGLVLGVFYGLMIYSMVMAFEQVQTAVGASRLNTVHAQAIGYAHDHGGYPDHVALLAVQQQTVPIQRLVVSRPKRLGSNRVTVGAYDFVDYDGSYKADQEVIAAVDGIDKSAPIYRFGDTNFVRLAEPTSDPGIVFCWQTDPDTGAFVIVMDDGSTDTGLPGEWAAVRATDAAARARSGLAPLELPEVP